ncbi:TIGR01777 family oxidoreductase [Maricaulis sp. MIT060901]|uniref:TIGR01777 family oxidoreductase n=1 Tax=Maricaulis sp. MIT060901 TaxID=3096993 RepID=UPI003999A23B
MTALDILFIVLAVQVLLGGFDNLWHHEITEALPGRVSARTEIGLHAARELIYAGAFIIFAWFQPHGWLALLFGAVLVGEIVITLADFLEEDRTRRLPPFERVLHTVLAINYGVVLALLTPILWDWFKLEGAGLIVDRGLWSLFFTAAAIGVFGWGVRDAIAWRDLNKRAAGRTEPARLRPSERTVLITGATGFLGQDLVHRLTGRGDRVIALSRDTLKARALFGPRVDVTDNLDLLADDTRIHAIVNLAGANVADMPWWHSRKQLLLDSRLDTTRAVLALIKRLRHKPNVLVSASAVGAYGDQGETPLPEHAGRPLGVFTADLCRVWENEACHAVKYGVRVCRLRFGLIFGRDGSAFPKLALGRLFGIAPQFGDGQQWMSWVHKHDALRAIEFALDRQELAGPVNVAAPAEVRHGEVMRAIGGRGLLMPIPAALLRLGLGEMSELFLASQRVRPQRLQTAGFHFNYPDIKTACRDLTGKPKAGCETAKRLHDTTPV